MQDNKHGWQGACVAMSVAVVLLIGALWIVAHRHSGVIVIAPKACPQSASRAIWPHRYVVGRRTYPV